MVLGCREVGLGCTEVLRGYREMLLGVGRSFRVWGSA